MPGDDAKELVNGRLVERVPRHYSDSQTTSIDPVERALSHALEEAAKAGRFDVVVQLARELEARRLAGVPPNVVPIGRPKRG